MDNLLESVNLFNFPLNIMVVDDDVNYLNLIQQQLKGPILSTYTSPIEVIENISPININIKDFLEENFIGIKDLNYKNIEYFIKNCSNQHGILIADYNMPNINGIELLTQYSNTNLIKILLTNVYKIDEAVEAFNKNLINYYLPKDKLNIIVDVIRAKQKLFFEKITKNIMKFLGANSLNFLSDKNYISIFNNIRQQYNIKKYYILNSYGSYYLENETDKFIFSAYSTTDLSEIAKETPAHDKHNVEQGNLIPSYFSNENAEYSFINAKKQGNYSYHIEKIA